MLACWQGAKFQEGLLLNLDALDPLFPSQEVHVVHCNKVQNYLQISEMAFLEKHNFHTKC